VAITEGQPVDQDGTLAGNAAKMFGLAETDAAIGDQVAVTVLGTGIGIAGAAIAKDADLEVLTGKLVTRTAGVIVGRAMQAAAADGDKIEILLTP
jgi:hypothetical protein